ncbi:hypothetical protein [Pseudothermotoga sp.]
MTEELRQDLVQIKETISEKQLLEIAENAFKEALKATLEAKVRNIFETVKFLFNTTIKLVRYTATTIKEHGLSAPSKWLRDAKEMVKLKFKQLQELWSSMTPKQRVDSLIDATIVLATMLLVGGGLDFEGGLPDTDLAKGVKVHRNIFTHTILIGLVFEFLLRFLIATSIEARKRGFTPKSKLLNAVLKFAEKHHLAVISGMWLGLFVHFLKDSNYLASRTKPYFGIKNVSMRTHQNLLASNALLSLIFSKQDMKAQREAR